MQANGHQQTEASIRLILLGMVRERHAAAWGTASYH
jgi:hypothetical protein